MFTNTISSSCTNFSASINKNIFVKNVITYYYGYQNFGIGGGEGYIDITAWNTVISLPADANKYASVTASFYIDCKADDFFRFYLNGNAVRDYSPGYNGDWSKYLDTSLVYRGQTSFNMNLSQKDNTFSIHLISLDYPYFGEIYSSSVTITTMSK